MRTSRRPALLSCLALLAGLSAQAPRTPDAATALGAGSLPVVIPIHTGPDDPAGHGPYGYWAAGPSWKASFHGGFTFFPYVPNAATTRGWRWCTESVVVGDVAVQLDSPVMATTEVRCEYAFGGVTEAWDVRAEGVEQTFVFDRLPEKRGAIVVTGRIATPFAAEVREPGTGAITFREEAHEPVLHYGVAKAIDAAGRTTAVRTSFDGERIRLFVDAEFVAGAALPLVIDPLVSPAAASAMPIVGTATACATGAGEGESLFAMRRRISSSDEDAYAWRFTGTPGGYSYSWQGSPPVLVGAPNVATLVFSDLATTNSIGAIDVAEVDGTNSFVYAIQRSYSGGSTLVATLSQPWTSATVNSGVTQVLPSGRREPQIGGCRGSGVQALIVTTEFLSGVRRVRGNILNTTWNVLSSSFDLHSFASSAESFDPAVTDAAAGSGNWGVAWISDYGNPAGSEVRIAEITQLGFPTTTRVLGVHSVAREPRLAGSGGRYLATWLLSPSGSDDQLRSARYDINPDSTSTTIQERVIANSYGVTESLANGDVAFDHLTRSHWASTYAKRSSTSGVYATFAYCTRHGSTGAPLTTTSLASSSALVVANPCVAFRGYDAFGPFNVGTIDGFLVSFSTQEPNCPLYWFAVTHGTASAATYGTSCRSNMSDEGQLPYAGSEFYSRSVYGLPANTPTILLAGVTPANVPLDSLGMTGCALLVDFAWMFGAAASATGVATATVNLPDDPIFQGSLHVQWLWLDGAANPAGLVTSRAITLDVQ